MTRAPSRRLAGWGADPPDTIRHWHLDAEAAEAVERWFGGWVPDGARLDGDRSVRLPLPSGRRIKVKGAGLRGGPVDFTRLRATGPKALWFDFEGRVAEDVAMGHDAAHPGGASFQQAVAEWQVSRRLAAAGERVLPCLGYGRITRDGRDSWFSVFDLAEGLAEDRSWPHVAAEIFTDRVARVGETALRLALRHGLIGYPWLVSDGGGGFVIKDLHPFRAADPVNLSAVSFTMLLHHALHVISSDIGLRAQAAPGLPGDLRAIPFRAALPEATLDDHRDAVERVVLPYMLRPAPGFSAGALVAALRSNRITARLLELAPPDYARFD